MKLQLFCYTVQLWVTMLVFGFCQPTIGKKTSLDDESDESDCRMKRCEADTGVKTVSGFTFPGSGAGGEDGLVQVRAGISQWYLLVISFSLCGCAGGTT